MRPTLAILLAFFALPAMVHGDDKKEAATKVQLADLSREPEKFAGRTVQFEGIVEETPTRSGGVLRLERSLLAIVCESKPDVVTGDRVQVTAVCEYRGSPSKLKILATNVERIIGNESAIPVTAGELREEPRKFDGKLIVIEGVLRNSPEAIEFNGDVRYSVRISAGVAITCHGKPTAVRGDRIRVFGTLTYSDQAPTPLLLDANAVEVVPR
ncbi:MAG: hypothetical protein C0467_18265 [Planctomycetaceae bacterium]|nr:hypothetical protein [Planctomycetaceae bacterium]